MAKKEYTSLPDDYPVCKHTQCPMNKEATTMFDNDAKMAADSLSVEERF